MAYLVKIPRNIWVIDAFLLFVIACAQPAFLVGSTTYSGLTVLALGWLGPLAGVWSYSLADIQLAWYANLFLLAAWLCIIFQWRRLAVFTSAIGLVLSLDTFMYFLTGFPLCVGATSFRYEHTFGLGIGAYLWFGSIILTLIGAVLSSLVVETPKRASKHRASVATPKGGVQLT